MVKFNTPRYEIDVHWDDRQNAECPLNDVKDATFRFFKSLYWCDEGGEELDAEKYGNMMPYEIVSNFGVGYPLFVNVDHPWDLSTSQNMHYNCFVGVVTVDSQDVSDCATLYNNLITGLADYEAWGNGNIIGCDVYRILPHGKEYVTSKCGWYLEDLEDMVCTAEGELEADGYVAVNIPDDMWVE